MSRIKFFNIEIDNLSMEEALREMDRLAQNSHPSFVVTPNVNHIVRLDSDSRFQEVYRNADLVLADGKPIVWVSRRYGTPIREKVSGADLFPRLCEMAAKKGYSMFFLGAGEGIAAKAAENLTKRYAGLKIAGVYSPPQMFEKDPVEVNKAISEVNAARPDILVVGLGTPKQEYFIYENLSALNVPLSLGLGASLDFEAGSVKRAPGWISDHGLEWLYRCMQEPKRLTGRYVKDAFSFLRLIWINKNRNRDV